MRILINALFLIPNRVGGSETYLRGLLSGLARMHTDDQFLVVVGPESAATFRPWIPGWRVVTSPTPSRKRAARLLLEQTWLPAVAQRWGCDVIHSAGYTAPIMSAGHRVVSILDMNYKRHPEDLSLAERLVYAALIPSAARTSQHVVTLSEAARKDIINWIRVAPEAVTAIPLAPRENWPESHQSDKDLLDAAGVTGRYVLSVAATYPHKNLARLLQAFPLNPRNPTDVRLVLVGLGGRAQQAIRGAAQQRPGLIQVLGWVQDELLAALYRNAAALAFPSLYEGFGLPILEAMALGTPVLTSNYGAMSEEAGNAAELINPLEVESIQGGLQRITQDSVKAAVLRQRGFEWARQFTWDRTARLTYAIYASVRSRSG